MLGLHGHQLVTEVAKIRERYTIDVIRGMLIRLRLWPRSFAIPLDEAIHRTPKNRRLRFQLWSKLLADCVDHLHRLIYNILDDRNAVSPVVAKEGMKLRRVLEVLVQIQNYRQLFV
ncbi:hypothetical protein KCU94_g153, partial [Aureobasidium melanogenum]